MQKFDWLPFNRPDKLRLREAKESYHTVLQSVAVIGRRFLHESENDDNATLDWVPGLTRLAGKWVQAKTTFRASLSFVDFSIYLVDEKINTVASFSLDGKSQLELLVWLEEQVGKLGLDASGLKLKFPYELPAYFQASTDSFKNPAWGAELSKYFHNSFVALRDLAANFKYETSTITIWPHHFDQAMTIKIKDTGDPETDTTLLAGMSPGDSEFDQPYLYMSAWPHIDISSQKELKDGARWHEEDWTGAVLLSEDFAGKASQRDVVNLFYQDVGKKIIAAMLS